MRYPEDKIKEAILHPDIEIRDRATSYFAKSFSSDLSIMPLVIKAVETYGRQNDAYRLIGASRDLPQTEETIAWVIDELNDPQADQYENYAYNLSMVLVDADPALLLPRESDILEARHFLADLREPLTERLRMLSWDEATCWQKLEEFCEEGKDKQYTNEVNLGYANRIVEALARYGQECEAKVRDWLAVKLDDYSHHPMKWLEPLVVRLAGQAHLESTIPLIVAKLHEDGDLLNEECAESPDPNRHSCRACTPSLRRSPTADTISASTPPHRWNTSTPTWPWRSACQLLADRKRTMRMQTALGRCPLVPLRPRRNRGRTSTPCGPRTRLRGQGLAELPAGNLHSHGRAIPRIRRMVGDREGREGRTLEASRRARGRPQGSTDVRPRKADRQEGG